MAKECEVIKDNINYIFFPNRIVVDEEAFKLKKLLKLICLKNEAFSLALMKNEPFAYIQFIYLEVKELEKAAEIMMQNFLS